MAEQDRPDEGIDIREIEDLVKAFKEHVSLDGLRANLRTVAESRRLQGATLNLTLKPDHAKPDYYNIYRYAFFGFQAPEDVDVLPATERTGLTERFEAVRKK